MVSISFVHPQYLFLLILIPIFIFIHLFTLRNTKKSALKFANFQAIARIKGIDFFSKNIVIVLLSSLIAALMIMALSGMTVHMSIEASSHSFVVAMDSSRSMEADDLAPNRLEAAKEAAKNFVDEVPFSTKFGVISFAGNAFIEQDMTDVRTSVKAAIDNVAISPLGGTDLYDPVLTATNMLKAEDSKAIILLSDGQINVGNVDEAINYANDNNVLIHTIAMGTEEGGQTSFGLSTTDTDSLEAIAYNTNGKFFRVTNKEELSQAFSDAIVLTEKNVGIESSRYSIFLALLLFSFLYYLINSKYRGWP